MTILVIVYLLFFLPFLLIYCFVSEFVFYFSCLCCCIERDSFSSVKRVLRKNLWRITTKFLAGSLDIFHLLFCFQNCMPICLDHIQPCLDVLGLLKDVALICFTIGLGVFIVTRRISGGNVAPVVCFFLQCLPLAVILLVNVIRFRRNRKVSARVRDIFRVEDNVNVRVFYEDSIGGKECLFGNDCEYTYAELRVKYNKDNEVFKLLVLYV